jgi:hypothetical protein
VTIKDIGLHWFSGYGDANHTRAVNFPPTQVMVQAYLRGAAGGGLNIAGIKGFRRRLPSGADEDVNFGEWPSWPAAAFDRMTSVTFALACGSRQQAWGVFRIDVWG